MTSFTRKLYAKDPTAAEAFAEAQRWENRHTYGKTPTLVQFDPGFKKLNTSFGKRETPPATKSDCPLGQSFCRDNGLMAYNCSLCKTERDLPQR
jgi:hypothetical protein